MKDINFGFTPTSMCVSATQYFPKFCEEKKYELPLATGQSRLSSWYDTALELQRLWVQIPPEEYACDFVHRTLESTEYTVLTHIGVYG